MSKHTLPEARSRLALSERRAVTSFRLFFMTSSLTTLRNRRRGIDMPYTDDLLGPNRPKRDGNGEPKPTNTTMESKHLLGAFRNAVAKYAKEQTPELSEAVESIQTELLDRFQVTWNLTTPASNHGWRGALPLEMLPRELATALDDYRKADTREVKTAAGGAAKQLAYLFSAWVENRVVEDREACGELLIRTLGPELGLRASNALGELSPEVARRTRRRLEKLLVSDDVKKGGS